MSAVSSVLPSERARSVRDGARDGAHPVGLGLCAENRPLARTRRVRDGAIETGHPHGAGSRPNNGSRVREPGGWSDVLLSEGSIFHNEICVVPSVLSV